MNAPVAYPLTVYYDASCPLCRAEIEALKARDNEDAMRLVDCSAADFSDAVAASEGVTRQAMMARIHGRDAAGRWHRGMDVFAAVYAIAGMRRLARIYASPLLRPWLERLYPWIADNRQLLSRLGLPWLFKWVLPRAAAACDGDCNKRRFG